MLNILIFILIATTSCSAPYKSSDGKISLLNTANKNSFSFSVSEEFIKSNSSARQDKQNPILTKAESGLLTHLLKQKGYCAQGRRTPDFVVTSKQEKIFDVTYAHLIEQSYNAKPVALTTYFGHCKTQNNE